MKDVIQHFKETLGMRYDDLAEYAFIQDGVIRERYFIDEYLPYVAVSPRDTGADGYDFYRRREVEIKSPCFSSPNYKTSGKCSLKNGINLKITYGSITEEKYREKILNGEEIYIAQYYRTELLVAIRIDFEDVKEKYLKAVQEEKKNVSMVWSDYKGCPSTQLHFIDIEKVEKYKHFFSPSCYEWVVSLYENSTFSPKGTPIKEKIKALYGDVEYSIEDGNKVTIGGEIGKTYSFSTIGKKFTALKRTEQEC